MMYPRRRRDVRRAYLCRGGRVDLARVRAGGAGQTCVRDKTGLGLHTTRCASGERSSYTRAARAASTHTHTRNQLSLNGASAGDWAGWRGSGERGTMTGPREGPQPHNTYGRVGYALACGNDSCTYNALISEASEPSRKSKPRL